MQCIRKQIGLIKMRRLIPAYSIPAYSIAARSFAACLIASLALSAAGARRVTVAQLEEAVTTGEAEHRADLYAELKPTDYAHQEAVRTDYSPIVVDGKEYVLPLDSFTVNEVVPGGGSNSIAYSVRRTLFNVTYANYQLRKQAPIQESHWSRQAYFGLKDGHEFRWCASSLC
jgi:hypothetical protein